MAYNSMVDIYSETKSDWNEWLIFLYAMLSALATNEDTREIKDYSMYPTRQEEALKLADNKAVLIALFVIPSAISVHLHTLLFPFARRLVWIPVGIAQVSTIQELEFAWD